MILRLKHGIIRKNTTITEMKKHLRSSASSAENIKKINIYPLYPTIKAASIETKIDTIDIEKI